MPGRGDPRGDLMALQIALASLPAGVPGAEELTARVRLLWNSNRDAWLAPYGRLQVTYERGFAESLRGNPAEFVESGEIAALDACVRTLYLQGFSRRIEIDALSSLEALLPHVRL